jgi:uncharacterized membrane protein
LIQLYFRIPAFIEGQLDLNQRSVLVHRTYVATLLVKGLDGAIETLAGLIIGIAGSRRLYALVVRATVRKLAHQPNDIVIHLIRHWFLGLTTTSNSFVVLYLIMNGVLKLAIAISLLLGKRWIFPIAVAILSAFILYMSYRLTIRWSWWLFGFAAVDLLTVVLVINEWQSAKRAEIKRP